MAQRLMKYDIGDWVRVSAVQKQLRRNDDGGNNDMSCGYNRDDRNWQSDNAYAIWTTGHDLYTARARAERVRLTSSHVKPAPANKEKDCEDKEES